MSVNCLIAIFIVKNRRICHSLQLKCVKKCHDNVILTSASRSDICFKKLAVVDLPVDKNAFDCKYIPICLQLNTFIRLAVANSFN